LRAQLARPFAEREGPGPVDFVMIFAGSHDELVREFDRAVEQLAPAGMLWACWRKKSSGMASDLDDDGVREVGLAAGLVDVKVCAVTEVWSGLKFVRRRSERSPERVVGRR